MWLFLSDPVIYVILLIGPEYECDSFYRTQVNYVTLLVIMWLFLSDPGNYVTLADEAMMFVIFFFYSLGDIWPQLSEAKLDHTHFFLFYSPDCSKVNL